MDLTLEQLVQLIDANDGRVPAALTGGRVASNPYHWNLLTNTETFLKLPLESWFKIIKRQPKWWVFRGPFNEEAYQEQYREQIIMFLIENPSIADLYFSEESFSVNVNCDPVRESLKTDPRISALIMALI